MLPVCQEGIMHSKTMGKKKNYKVSRAWELVCFNACKSTPWYDTVYAHNCCGWISGIESIAPAEQKMWCILCMSVIGTTYSCSTENGNWKSNTLCIPKQGFKHFVNSTLNCSEVWHYWLIYLLIHCLTRHWINEASGHQVSDWELC